VSGKEPVKQGSPDIAHMGITSRTRRKPHPHRFVHVILSQPNSFHHCYPKATLASL